VLPAPFSNRRGSLKRKGNNSCWPHSNTSFEQGEAPGRYQFAGPVERLRPEVHTDQGTDKPVGDRNTKCRLQSTTNRTCHRDVHDASFRRAKPEGGDFQSGGYPDHRPSRVPRGVPHAVPRDVLLHEQAKQSPLTLLRQSTLSQCAVSSGSPLLHFVTAKFRIPCFVH
jgi:hypothetical protein